MELIVARQLFELTERREKEGIYSLTNRERGILDDLKNPSYEEAKSIFQAVSHKKEVENKLQSYITAHDCRWANDANEFMENYYTQKGMGMTDETELALCERAVNKLIPIDVIRLITRHSANWMSANGITSQRRKKHDRETEDQSSGDRSYISAV